MQNGDLKLVGNLEYRTRLSGNLGGALFIDMGNVWNWEDIQFDESNIDGPDYDPQLANDINRWLRGTKLQMAKLIDQLAIGTGTGLRYDLGFLVIRIDWGLALHVPYATSRSRYLFNWDHFRDAQALHFAIGYPF